MRTLVGLFHLGHRRLSLSSALYFSFSTSAPTSSSSSSSSSILSRYLTDTFSFPYQRALSVSNRFPAFQSDTQKPESVVHFLRNFGFSDSQVRSIVLAAPNILFRDVDKIIKPKLDYYKYQLGFIVSDLGNLVPKNPLLLLSSLDKKLIPFVESVKRVLSRDENNRDLIRVLHRSSRFIGTVAQSRLVSNISFLERCKIVSLDVLLIRNPFIFTYQESVLRERISRVLELGFRVDSRIFVYALLAVCCMSDDTFRRKLQLFKDSGFSENECMEMFKRCPLLFNISEEKLKIGINFFLNETSDFKSGRSMLIRRPLTLNFSMKDRIIPRCRVLRVVKNKGLLKKEPSLSSMLCLSENDFVEKFISRFGDDAEELRMVYKGDDLLDSSEN